MSVLFKALSKASREGRKGGKRGVAPAVPSGVSEKGFWRMEGAAIAVFVIVALLAYAFFARRGGNENRPTPQTAVSVAGGVSPQMKMSHVKVGADEPQGIALPVESLSPEIEEVAQQLQDAATPKTVGEKKEDSEIDVNGEEKPEISEWLREAQSFIEERDYLEAVELYDKVLEADAGNQSAWAGKIFALEQEGSDESMDDLLEIAKKKPELSVAHAALARRYMLKGEIQKSMDEWERASALEPRNDSYRLSLAILYDRKGMEKEALALYRTIADLPPAARQRMEYLSLRTPSEPEKQQ